MIKKAFAFYLILFILTKGKTKGKKKSKLKL